MQITTVGALPLLPDRFQGVPAVVIGVDGAATVVFCSLDPHGAWGMSLTQLGLPLDRPMLERALKGETVVLQRDFRDAAGRRNYEITLRPWPTIGVQVFVVDVSERQQIRRRLLASESRFYRLISVMPYGIAYTDLDGRLIISNAIHDTMLGYAPGEPLGMYVWDFFDPREQAAQRDFFFQAIRERQTPVPNYGKCLRKDGTLLDVRFHWAYDTDENGQLLGFISILSDMSNEIRAKRELEEAKAEAERTRDEKSRFLAAASHDLQQPLHSLSIMLGLLRQNGKKQRRDVVINQMELALDGAQALLGAVLELSKLEARVIKPRLEAIAVADLFVQLAADFGPLFMKSALTLKIRPSKFVVESDRVLLRSILHNLLSNALRYTEKGKVLLSSRRRGQTALLEIWDTGIGIPEDKHKEIFREFTRLKPEHQIAGRTHALGLGLSIVERACDLLGHKITVRSKLGVGSVFSLQLPLLSVAEAAQLPATRSASLHLPNTVLIIDDDYRLAKNTKDLFKSWGFASVIAQDRQQALDAARKAVKPFDLILADYNLQNQDNGIAVAQDVREHFRREIPIILVTAESAIEVRDLASTHGIEFLAKPARPARLRALVDFTLSNRASS